MKHISNVSKLSIYQWQLISSKLKVLQIIRVLKNRTIKAKLFYWFVLECPWIVALSHPPPANEPLHSRSRTPSAPSIMFLWQRTLIAWKVQTSQCVRQHRQHRWRAGARNGIWISLSIMNSEPTFHFVQSFINLTCEPFKHGDVLETLEVVDEHIGDPEVIEELQGHGVPELGLHRVICPNSGEECLLELGTWRDL